MSSRTKKNQDTGIDRLSVLHDDILHHILSFLDTESSIRTCVLSKRWTSLWKHVPALTLRVPSRSPRFYHRANHVLSLRSDKGNLRKVKLECGGSSTFDILDWIAKYAASHGVQELSIRTRSCSLSFKLDLVGIVRLCYRSLKILELHETHFRKDDDGSWSSLQMLESLTLSRCFVDFGDSTLAHFPRLESLKLFKCVNGFGAGEVLKVIAPKLLNLDIVFPNYYAWGLKIVAPELESFTFEIADMCNIKGDMSESNLPSLRRANIKLFGDYKCLFYNNTARSTNDIDALKQRVIARCVNLFKILHDVQALSLEVEIIEVLIQLCNSQESSPFKKLKSLNLKCREKSLDDAPNQVVSYFLGSSPNNEEKTRMV
ncbi:Putative F-box/FBD/LRR-repeat protein At3g49030 [Linum grandiflorum]